MTTVLAEDGREQVCGYHLPGDLFGLDGIDNGRHKGQSIALEDSEICAVPLERLEELARHVPALQRNLHRFLSREIDRDHNVMLLLGSMRAEERLAAFLLNLAEQPRVLDGQHGLIGECLQEIDCALGKFPRQLAPDH